MNKWKGVGLFALACMVGCAPNPVRVQTYDKYFSSNQKTNVVAGLKKVEDKRPEDQKERDQRYDRPTAVVVNEHLYKNLKLSGLFDDVLFENFVNDKVDVVLTPCLNSFFYAEKASGATAVATGMSLIPFVGLFYLAAGGPVADHYAVIDFELRMTTTKGEELAVGGARKELSLASNAYNYKTDGIGMLEGRVLGEATPELILSLASNVDLRRLPVSKFSRISSCGSDRDCKGDRICVVGKCVDPESRKNLLEQAVEAK